MLNSVFVCGDNGEVLIEKHMGSVIPRNFVEGLIKDWVLAAHGGHSKQTPIVQTGKNIFAGVVRGGIVIVGVALKEFSGGALLMVEFLHRVADLFQEYFGPLDTENLKENFVTAYQIMEEVIDNGYPFTTEPNILKDMIAPPTIMNRAVNAVTGTSAVMSKLPNGSISSIPWRRTDVKYTSNEIYFDIIEEIDAILESNGAIVSSEIQGKIMGKCKLSGMPDLLLSFLNPRILDDVRFHPCVRLNRFERDRVLSFVPPDGVFELISYKVNTGTNAALPIYVKPQIFFAQGSGKIDISVGAKHTEGKAVENVVITIPLPQNATGVNGSVNHGNFKYDQQTKKIKWNIGKIPKEKIPMFNGNATFQSGTQPEGNTVITADFKINLFAASGLKIDSLQIIGESYKPYKGVRWITQSGKFQIRT